MGASSTRAQAGADSTECGFVLCDMLANSTISLMAHLGLAREPSIANGPSGRHASPMGMAGEGPPSTSLWKRGP